MSIKKEIKKIIFVLMAGIMAAIPFVTASTTVYAAEKIEMGTAERKILEDEVDILYTKIFVYNKNEDTYVVNENELNKMDYTDQELQGVQLLLTSLNSRAEDYSTNNKLASIVPNNIISEINTVMDGNESSLIQPMPETRGVWETIQGCFKDAVGVLVSVVKIKSIVNLFKAGKFEAAATALVKAVGATPLTIVSAIGFIAFCGAKEVS